MREIEVKARLDNKGKVTEELVKLGCVFEAPVVQEDTVYARNIGSIKELKQDNIFLRIRVRNKEKIFFTLKKDISNGLDKIEHEVEVNSKEEIEQIIHLLGFKKSATVSKSRTKTHYKDCEICIDEVENLGSFIEMEKITEEENSDNIQEELFKFLQTLGVNEGDRVFSGYDILMMQKDESKKIILSK